MPWVNYKAEALSVNSKAFYSREKSSVCIRSKHCGLPGLPDHADLTKKQKFTHVGLSAHAHNNYCTED